MKAPPKLRVCGMLVLALLTAGCAIGRARLSEPQPGADVVPREQPQISQSEQDPLYRLIRQAFVARIHHPNRVSALLDSAARLLPRRFVPEPVAGTASTRQLVSLVRATLESYHAVLPHAAPIAPQTPLGHLLDALPPAIASDLSNHPHYRDLYIRKLAGLADVPIDLTPEVRAYIQFFRTDGRRFFTHWLARATAYLPMIQAEFQQAELPQDLAYKAMIESGFNPRAQSRARALGLWQFMRYTGALYGLKRNTWVDDRMNPEKATRAAAKHLARLYDHFGDWRLVIAAYNCGQGRLDRAIRESGTRNFWEIHTLPGETRNHLPKFMAAVIIAKHPEWFGFTDIAYQPPLNYDTVSLTEPVALRLAAQCAGTSHAWMQQLNPELRRGYTPPAHSKKPFLLRVPKGSAAKFKANYAKVPDRKKIQMVDYIIKPGDTISGIAHRLGVRVQAVLDANGIRNPRRVRSGKKLSIPIHPERRTQLALWRNIDRNPDAKTHERVMITVRRGDTLWDIARREGLTAAHLRAWNNLKPSQYIHPGDRLVLFLPRSDAPINAYYTVRRGDTLWDIARVFQTSVADLKTWNDIQKASALRAGTRIRVRPATDEAVAE